MSERQRKPDYELEDSIRVTEPEQFKAMGDSTRHKIISLITEKAATTSQLAEALGQPKGSVGHHLKVLESAGLIRVVRTRKVRALTEKYYGRTARLFEFSDPEGHEAGINNFFQRVMDEYEETDQAHELLTIRRARIPTEKAREYQKRVAQLADEFGEEPSVSGERVYGLLAQFYLTNLPELPEEE